MTTLHDLTKSQLIEVVRKYQAMAPLHLQKGKKRLTKKELEDELKPLIDIEKRDNKYYLDEHEPRHYTGDFSKTVRKSQKGIKKPRKVKFGKKATKKQAEELVVALVKDKVEQEQPTTQTEVNDIIEESKVEATELIKKFDKIEIDKIIEEVKDFYKKGYPVDIDRTLLPPKKSRGRPKKMTGSGMYNMTRRDGGNLMYHFPKTGRGGSIFSSIDDTMNKLSSVPGVDGIPFYNLVHQYAKHLRRF
jgi:hypothetical protein